MARTDNLTNFFTDVADAIRSKTGNTEPIACEDFDTEIESISGGANLQTKSVTITENGTTSVVPDTGYDGLDEVNITTTVSGGGDIPTKGFVVKTWDSNGYPKEIDLYGTSFPSSYLGTGGISNCLTNITKINIKNNLTNIPDYFCSYLGNLTHFVSSDNVTTIGASAFNYCRSLANINLSSSITSIGANAFNQCFQLNISSLPTNLTTIGNSAFEGCYGLALTELPAGLTYIGTSAFNTDTNVNLTSIPSGITRIYDTCFRNCNNSNLKKLSDNVTYISATSFMANSFSQMSFNNVATIIGSGAGNGAFRSCTSLKAIWIGSGITSSGFGRYVFNGCSNVQKMYINLPRATVEAFTNYQYAFSSSSASAQTLQTSVIICNDDTDFITKEEFDAINWENYVEE